MVLSVKFVFHIYLHNVVFCYRYREGGCGKKRHGLLEGNDIRHHTRDSHNPHVGVRPNRTTHVSVLR